MNNRLKSLAFWLLAYWCLVAGLSLVALYFKGLEQNPLFANWYDILGKYVLELFVALSAAGLSHVLTNIFGIGHNVKFSEGWLLASQGTIAALAFVVVFAIGPEDQMRSISDAVFYNELDGCRSAALNPLPSSDAQERCEALVEKYPFRPEPLEVLGRFTYSTSSLVPEKLGKSRDYYEMAFSLYEISLEEEDRALRERFSDEEISVLRDVVYGTAVQTANASLREYGLSGADKEGTIAALERAKEYLTLAQRLAETTTSASYRIRVKSMPAVIDLYKMYLLDAVEYESLEKVKVQFKLALAQSEGTSSFQNYNIFVVAAVQAYAFKVESMKVEAAEAIVSYIASLPGELENPRSAIFGLNMMRWLKQIVQNRREDLFVITRPVGGKIVAGESMRRFFDEHASIRNRLLDIVAF